MVDVGTRFRVTSYFHPSPDTPNLFEDTVTIENLTDSATDLRYRRVAFFDERPWTYNDDEYLMVNGSGSPRVVFDSDAGYGSPDPLTKPDQGSHTGDFGFEGPNDLGPLFDFALGQLDPHEVKTIKLFYGATTSSGQALGALGDAGAEAYALGQPTARNGGPDDTINTMIFGFKDGDVKDKPSIDPSPTPGDPNGYSDYISADSPTASIEAYVTAGMDDQGDPQPVGDGTVIQWRVEGPDGGILAKTESTTTNGVAVNTLNTTTKAGDTFKVFAKIIKLVQNGQTIPWDDTEVEVGEIMVVPGAVDTVDVTSDLTSLPADGKSTTTVTVKAYDAEGNPVADGTPVEWDFGGAGDLLANVGAVINKGQATAEVRSSVFSGSISVSASIEGVPGSTDIDALPLQINLGITGNVLTLGSNETQTVAAYVTDTSGKPVADGTPIAWTIQKGGFAVKDTVTHGGWAYLTITGMNGSQIPGVGIIGASIGSTSVTKTYFYVRPTGQLAVQADHPLLAGDQRFDGNISIDQADGTSRGFDFYAKTTVTISGGTPNGELQIRLPQSGQTGYGLLYAIGDDGTPASTVDVKLDGNGQGSFVIGSNGQLPTTRQVALPISILQCVGTYYGEGTAGGAYTNTWAPKATLNIALQSAQHIANAQNYIGKLGWAVAAGPGNSLDEVAADMAFSLIPVVGVYSDIRDAASELLKLWPGGEDPDWLSFGLAVAGIITEITPADFALDVAKGLAKAAKLNIIQPGGVLIKYTLNEIKTLGSRAVAAAGQGVDAVIKEIDDTFRFIQSILPPPIGGCPVTAGGVPFLTFFDQHIAQAAQDIPVFQSLNSVFQNFPQSLAGFVTKYGDDVAKQVEDVVGGLAKPLQEALANGNKLDVVAEGIAKGGWDPRQVEKFAQKFQNADAATLSKFEDYANVKGSGNLIDDLPQKDQGLLTTLTYADSQGKDNVVELSRSLGVLPNGNKIGEIDVITNIKAIEVKSNVNSNTADEIEAQVTRLVNFARAEKKTPVFAYSASVAPRKKQDKILKQLQNDFPDLIIDPF